MKKTVKNLQEFVVAANGNNGAKKNLNWLDELKELMEFDVVRVDPETIETYSYDAWPVSTKWKNQGKHPFSPDVVVYAYRVEQVSKLLQWATNNNVPVTPWGGGSSVTGQPLATKGGIILDMTKMNRVILLDEESLFIKVQAGMFGHELEKGLNEQGYTLNHSPQSLDRSTVGGWIATRAMGQFSSRYGGIEDLIVSYTVVLPTGEIVETMHVPRAAVGPDLRHLFMGAEGTLGIITDVTLKIFPIPETRILEAVSFDSVENGVTVMRQMMRVGLRPFLVRFYDFVEARHALQDNKFDKTVMFLGFEGLKSIAQAEYAAAMDLCMGSDGIRMGPDPVAAWMKRRFDFSTVENLLAEPGGLAETIEIAHFWDGILDTYYELKDALAPYANETLGHFSHVYPQGTSLYIILLGKEKGDAEAESKLLEIWDIAMRICLKRGAAISHHHGSGIARLPYVRESLGSSMQLLEKIKAVVDPAAIMNPDKLSL